MKLETLNELVKLAELGMVAAVFDRPGKIYGLGPNAIVYYDEKAAKHQNLLDELYRSDSGIAATISHKSFCDYLIGRIREKKVQKEAFVTGDIKAIKDHFLQLPLKEIPVWKEIGGIHFKKESLLKLGGFTVLNWEKEKGTIEATIKYNPEVLWMGRSFGYLIGITTFARDLDKARDIAEGKFRYFENIIHFLIGYPSESYQVFISHPDNGLIGRSFSYSPDLGMSMNMEGWKKVILPLELDNEYFRSTEFLKFYELILAPSPNDMEKRLLSAASWLGQAMRENDAVSGYLKAVISIELLFTREEGSLIIPSVTYQIAESMALILGQNVEQRIEIEKDLRKLYGERSAIVHGGKENVSREAYLKACEYARTCILTLLNEGKYRVDDIAALSALLKREKYS